MGRMHYADNSSAHAGRIIVLFCGVAELTSIIMLVLVQTIIGWDTDFWFTFILLLSALSLVASIFSFAVVIFPYDRAGERGVIPALWAIEAGAIIAGIGCVVWRVILITQCDKQPCIDQERACIVMLAINCGLIILSLLNLLGSALLYQNTIAEPTRAEAKKLQKQRDKQTVIELKNETEESDEAPPEEEEEEEPEEEQEETPDYLTGGDSYNEIADTYAKKLPAYAMMETGAKKKDDVAVRIDPPPVSTVTHRSAYKDPNELVFI